MATIEEPLTEIVLLEDRRPVLAGMRSSPLPPPSSSRRGGRLGVLVAMLSAVAIGAAALGVVVNASRHVYAGYVTASNQLALDFPDSGVVQSVDVHVGSHVHAGEVLAAEAAYTAAVASVRLLQQQLGHDEVVLVAVTRAADAAAAVAGPTGAPAAGVTSTPGVAPTAEAAALAAERLAQRQEGLTLAQRRLHQAQLTDVARARAAVTRDGAALAAARSAAASAVLVAPRGGVIVGVGVPAGGVDGPGGVRVVSSPAQAAGTTPWLGRGAPGRSAPGGATTAGVPAFVLQVGPPQQLVANLPAAVAAGLRTGAPVRALVPALGDRVLVARFTGLANADTPVGKAPGIAALFAIEPGALRGLLPGMAVDVRLPAHAR